MFLNSFFNFIAVSVISLVPLAAHAQLNLPPVSPSVEQVMEKITRHAPVVKALEDIKASSVRMFEEQVRITEIPAPPYKESARAAYYLKKKSARRAPEPITLLTGTS